MNPVRRESLVEKYAWHGLTLVAGWTMAYATLRAEVAQKANKTEVEALRAAIDRIDRRTATLVAVYCLSHRAELGCNDPNTTR